MYNTTKILNWNLVILELWGKLPHDEICIKKKIISLK